MRRFIFGRLGRIAVGIQPELILNALPVASAAAEFTATDLASGNATLGLTGDIGTKVRKGLIKRYFPDLADLTGPDDRLAFTQDSAAVGRNSFVYVVRFPQRDPQDIYRRNEAESNRMLDLNGSEWSFVVTITSDRGAEGGAYQAGDWLESKDGGNQRMMIVSAGQPASVAASVPAQAYFPSDGMAHSASAPGTFRWQRSQTAPSKCARSNAC